MQEALAARLDKKSQSRLEVPSGTLAVRTVKPLAPIKITRDDTKYPQVRA